MWTPGRSITPLDDAASIRVAIEYVQKSPDFGRLPRQKWGVVTPFEL
ncbi:MAG: hypothetical protein QM770_02855 [Tepidisphaeraceae bacterium]